MEKKQILLRKYFHKQCSRKELEELFGYLRHDPEEQYQEVIYELWQTLHPAAPLATAESEKMYAQMKEKMEKHTPSFRLSPTVWKVAATFTGLLIMASFFVFYFLKTGGVTMHTTDYGEMATIELPDASTVVLNGNSTLQYQGPWEEGTLREVWVEGEAYFSVRHLEGDTKFKVHTQNLTIEVLGTEFNVTNRRGNTQVTLNTGSIRLDASPEASGEVVDVIMKPGEQAVLTQDQKFELKVVDPELFTSWKEHELVFQNASLQEVASIIEDTYGVSVHFEDSSLRTLKITGSLPNKELDVLTGMLGEILNVKIARDKDKIYINKK